MSPKTITRADLVEALHKRGRIPRTLATRFLESILDTVETALVAGDTVKLARFGNFVVRDKRAREGRNPKTGEAARITPRRVVTFRPSQLMRTRVAGPAKRPAARKKRARV